MENTEQVPVPAPKPLDPYELIAKHGGPSKEEINVAKAQTPNGKIKILVLEGERIFLMRALSLMEQASLAKQIPRNSEPEVINREMPLLVVAKCCFWTSVTKSGKLTSDELKVGAAGLTNTLYTFVEQMSDYVNPENFDLISTDL